MSVFSDKKGNYIIKILNSFEEISTILKENDYLVESYKYDLEIYMVNKNEDFTKIKKLDDIKDYAIIKDENGNRKILLKTESYNKAKIYSIFLAHELLYKLGYYELFYINKDIYSYKKESYKKLISFEILNIKSQGCFFKIDNITLEDFKKITNKIKEIGIKFEEKKLKFDYIQEELNKVLFKRKL